MPTDLVKRIDLDLLYPPFLEKALHVLAACRARGADFYATLGFRTFGEQDMLFAQGRTAPGKRVTNARGGYSAHNYGLALDLCRDADPSKPGLQPDWREPSYSILVEETLRAGLVSGASFDDFPHIQWPGYVTASQLEPLRIKFTWATVHEKFPRDLALKTVWASIPPKGVTQ